MNEIYQLQIALRGIEPKIWRRILVPSEVLLSDFHKIIQTTMGWINSHLHQFIKDRTFYSLKTPDDDFGAELNVVDYKNMILSDLLKTEKEAIMYEYDFGDSWLHDIVLEKKLPFDENIIYPLCVEGEMNCPPEDCGGIMGYVSMLEILNQPDHEEYMDYMEWLGEKYDPAYFDKQLVNELLQQEDFGCLEHL